MVGAWIVEVCQQSSNVDSVNYFGVSVVTIVTEPKPLNAPARLQSATKKINLLTVMAFGETRI